MSILKKLLFILGSIWVMIPTIVSAHTELTSSNPVSGQVVKQDLKEIVLTYEGEIESLSTMIVVKDGKDIPFVSVEAKDNQMVGTLSAPLDNGSYTIKWNVAGEDGHPITGEIPFTVQMDVNKPQKLETKEPGAIKDEQKKENVKQDHSNKQTADFSSNMRTILYVVVAVVLVAGFFLLFKRKH